MANSSSQSGGAVASCSSSARGCEVIEDVAKGWGGFCMGLQLQSGSSSEEACRASCCADARCEVWQWATKRSNRNPGAKMSCFTGKGFECRSVRTDDFLVYAGQRISHGTKLGDGVWCTGNGMRKTRYSSRISHQARMEKCQSACFNDVECHVWQYSTLKGCWSGSPNYGAIKCYKDISQGPGTILDGRRFDRSCETSGGKGTDYMSIFLIMCAAALLLLCLASVVLCFGLCAPKKPQTPRGPKSSRQQGSEDSDGGLSRRSEDPRMEQQLVAGAYRPLNPNSSPSGSSTPAKSLSMSESGSMGPLLPPGYAAGMNIPTGSSMPRPVDASFASSSSSFGQQGKPLLGTQYSQMQHGSASAPAGPPRHPAAVRPVMC